MVFLEILKKNLALVLALLVIAFSVIVAVNASPAYAAVDCNGLSGTDRSKCEICRGSGGTDYSNGECITGDKNPGDEVTGIVETVITLFSWIVGVTSVIMIMIGGFRYITSQGDSGNVSAAKNTILYAVIGLVVVALAQVIVNFVIGKI
jgi:hypothetical protein